ncbi:hypothetical protein QAD02_007458 [Eretmocerus hayati]|uniref:Uncharacterized protein n=1 Tax=Eretmocerus hayati TaxID=131215 RepID=A0ACC2N401_9HYME|nr:hypothetical protein QAD02_007458 [Eretmocerus hayati]
MAGGGQLQQVEAQISTSSSPACASTQYPPTPHPPTTAPTSHPTMVYPPVPRFWSSHAAPPGYLTTSASTAYYLSINATMGYTAPNWSLANNFGASHQQPHHFNSHQNYYQPPTVTYEHNSMSSPQYNGYIQPAHFSQQWRPQDMQNPTSTLPEAQSSGSSHSDDPKRRRIEEIDIPAVDHVSAGPSSTIRIIDTPNQSSSSNQNTIQVISPTRPMQRSLAEIRSGNYVYHCLKMQGIVAKQIFAAYDEWVREDDDTNSAYFRPKIARFVMSQAMDNGNDMKRDRFLYLRTSWGECFPKDAEGNNLTIVYEPSSTNVDAKGVLYVAYIYHNGNSYETGLLGKPKRKSNITDTDVIGVTQRAELQVLRALKLVTDENKQTWIQRLSVRLNFHQKSTLDEMLNDLIVLKADNAADLTKADFGVIHNGKENALLHAWPTLSSALIDLARFKAKNVKDKQDIVDCLTAWGDEPEVEHSVTSCMNAVETIVNDKENVSDRLRASQRKLATDIAKVNDELTPRVVFRCCPTSRRFFVVLSESTHYEVNNLNEAVDLCYECLVVFPMFKEFS